MTDIHCKSCGGVAFVKPGFVRGPQRYQCKGCGCNFTHTPAGGKPAAMKAMAVLLYSMGNASYGMWARLLGVSEVAIYKGVRAEAEKTLEPSPKPASGIVQIDEMWHFVNGKKTRFGVGGPLILWHGEPWPGCWAGVMTTLAKGSSINSELKETSS